MSYEVGNYKVVCREERAKEKQEGKDRKDMKKQGWGMEEWD